MTELEKLGKLFDQAQAIFSERDWPTTIALLRQVARENPEYSGVQEMLREAHKRHKALTEYEIGLGYLGKMRWKEAIKRFEVTIRDDPEHGDAQTKLKEARQKAEIERLLDKAAKYERKSNWEQVVRTLDRVLKLDPSLERVKQQRHEAQLECRYKDGDYHFKRREWLAAENIFEELEKDQPGYRDVPSKLKEIEKQQEFGELYRQAKELERASKFILALDLYEQVFGTDPNYKDIRKRIAYCNRQRVKLRSKTSTRIKVSWPVWWFLLGLVSTGATGFFFARPFHCLLQYKLPESVIVIIGALFSFVMVYLADRVRSDIKEALKIFFVGAAIALIVHLGLRVVFLPPPSEENCFPVLAEAPTPTSTPVAATPSVTFDLASLCNGSFDYSFSCWDHGGELTQTVVLSGSNHLAILGSSDYPCIGGIPIGEAWISQSFQVPDAGEPSLSFSYEVYSYDIDTSDTFEVCINKGQPNEKLITKAGNTEWTESDCEGEVWHSGWRSEKISLKEFKGKSITLSFRNVNRIDQSWNTWTLLDDVLLLP